ncbi:MAG: shikimate dehydrogenase [Alphaproteobacteria bacterium]|nr:shikimate dehydrogenase [Alphaproteobacteria bacterium]
MSPPFAAVVGWPAAHSLSPLMMATWLKAAGIEGRYGVLEVPPDRFEPLAERLAGLGLVGVNVTLPHKEAALAVAATASATAQSVGAANRLTVTAQGLHAHNTDVDGVAAALVDDAGTGPAVLIGAGGAARAALHHLKSQEREVRIVNRTRARAEMIASEFGVAAAIHTVPEDALPGAALIINATSLGMSGKTAFAPDFSVCAPDALAFDMVYTPLRTGFLTAAAHSGLRTVDGLSMLIGQARASFEAFYRAVPGQDSLVRPVLEARLEGRS